MTVRTHCLAVQKGCVEGQMWLTLVTIIISLAVAFIAYLQWRTATAVYREKLFDRRFHIFSKVLDYVEYVRIHDTSPRNPKVREIHPPSGDPQRDEEEWRRLISEADSTANGLLEAAIQSPFLFDENVSKYIEDLRSIVGKYVIDKGRLSRTKDDAERVKISNELTTKYDWIQSQRNEIYKIFMEQMRMSERDLTAGSALAHLSGGVAASWQRLRGRLG